MENEAEVKKDMDEMRRRLSPPFGALATFRTMGRLEDDRQIDELPSEEVSEADTYLEEHRLEDGSFS